VVCLLLRVFWINFKENINCKHVFIGQSHVLLVWGSVLLDTGRTEAGVLVSEKMLRVEMGRQRQG